MTLLATGSSESTSAGGFLSSLPRTPLLVGVILVGLGTSSAAPAAADRGPSSGYSAMATNAGVVSVSPEGAGAAIAEVRRLTGLTWEQLARVFGVSRRSLHLWASGKPMASANEERLQRVLATIRALDRGAASTNRSLLLTIGDDAIVPLDLLAKGHYDELLSRVGPGNARARLPMRPLSPAVRAARAPRPPAELVEASQDQLHRDSKTFRVGRSARS